jgi:hypothetical protein
MTNAELAESLRQIAAAAVPGAIVTIGSRHDAALTITLSPERLSHIVAAADALDAEETKS